MYHNLHKSACVIAYSLVFYKLKKTATVFYTIPIMQKYMVLFKTLPSAFFNIFLKEIFILTRHQRDYSSA